MASAPDAEAASFSLVEEEAPLRLQRAIGLAPRGGLGLVRRALVLALLCWLPIAVWALLRSRALPGGVAEPLLQHFGVHARCLVAIPLLVLAEGPAQAILARLIAYFVRSGVVPEGERARFAAIVGGAVQRARSSRPWAAILGVVVAWSFIGPVGQHAHELLWSSEGDAASPRYGFGGFWFLYVARPVYIALLLGWLWRLGLVFLLLARIARLDLALVPTHPDRAGGLGFLERLPAAFSLVVLAASAVVASRWAHDVVYHGVPVATLKLPIAAFLVLALLLFLAPMLPFAPRLAAAKRAALLDYGTLVGEHGRRVGRRWLAGESLEDDPLLGAPELGPVADTQALYHSLQKMRALPLGPAAMLSLLVPAALPILCVLALEIPVRELLLGLLKALA